MLAVTVSDVVAHRNQAVDDEALAARCAATTVLITADCSDTVESLARRIHAASVRAASPFVLLRSATLPVDAAMLTEACADVVDRCRGGSLLISDVEDMPTLVQDRLIETLACVQAAWEPTDRVRLIAGTTAFLCERIADGTFSEGLFYRLNVVHLVARTGTATNARASSLA
jgi:two-component system response regulator FlrC